ncbi:MAG: flagellar motor protein MotB [Desulfobacterales bacterium]|nr:flagellar motor protein MotB [Desulfobacterales bacterium]
MNNKLPIPTDQPDTEKSSFYGSIDSARSLYEYEKLFSGPREQKQRRMIWSIAWSDLMMTMFIFFAVLYIYQVANRDFSFGRNVDVQAMPEATTQTISQPEINNIETAPDADPSIIAEKNSDTLRVQQLSDIGTVELLDDSAVRVVLPADLLFDPGRAELQPRSIDALHEIADVLFLTDYKINVVGHTDDIPIHSEKFSTNWELSAFRACVVARFLIEERHLSPKRFYISGYSYYEPLKPNDSKDNRAVNRRVELILTKDKPAADIQENITTDNWQAKINN